MCTVIRPEISKRSKYWISKHRHYELKHFCLQYSSWKKALKDIQCSKSASIVERKPSSNLPGDPIGDLVITKMYYEERIKMIERIAVKTDKGLSKYILKAVTEGLSYPYLKARLDIPCSRDLYYDRYRRFFWLLSQERD